SGKTPFEGATTRDILRGHFTEAPKPLAELAPASPPPLAQAVHKLLAKKPEERFASAALLIAELERLRDGAAPRAPGSAAPKKSSSRGLLVVAVIAIAAIASWLARSKKDDPARTPDAAPLAKSSTPEPNADPTLPANANPNAAKPAASDDDSKL